MASTVVGSVSELWRFPVKSMGGEQMDEAEFSARGLIGDRAYALIDADSGKVVSAKSVRLFPDILNCRAAFVEPPRFGAAAPPVRIVFSEGATVRSDAADSDRVLSDHFKRNVRLAQVAPEDFTIDMYHPDLGDLDPAGPKDVVLDQKLGAAYFGESGRPSPVAAGAFFDLFPASVLTESTIDRLNELRPESQFDHRRFRMNVIIKAKDAGFVENEWVGHELKIGDARLRIAVPDSRCVMTTLAQGELARDPEILKTLARHNKVQVGDAGKFPCAGVYAVVEETGIVRTGDQVVLT